MTADNVILNKVQTIRRCIKRILEEYDGNRDNLNNITKQDAIVLNLQRACEACIDLAMHVISVRNLGLPQSSREAFELLEESGVLHHALAKNLKAMVGFRNIAVHDYQSLNISIVESIIERHLDDFRTYCDLMMDLNA
ncbi:type VII toxin-antitoxin system HepT family RNase toxin [Alicyclobacillus shizuokensis]|uniref:type VII toxin-antitoxin system HepT family RNase toxin n=1 Tax=Alicyclobacillus shizuokensis TaxID=392014 RepID=UPI0008302AB6|nr:DUF86 domain-containing protein [Alicyclobacillus shizuokensis]MCL6626657.1 DUF86 domain-containing protein [Alicyclobacillus shizuokensis]